MLRLIFCIFSSLISLALLVGLETMKLNSHPVAYPEQGNCTTRAQSAERIKAFSKVNWSYWKRTNPHIKGWLDIPALNISLPIAQPTRTDPTYYLSHDAYKNMNLYGCPFIDSSCKNGLKERNTLILAHNMSDGSMFSGLAKTPTRKTIYAYIQTAELKEKILLKKWKTINASRYSVQTSFNSIEEFVRWKEENIAPSKNQASTARTITFCTCSYGLYKNQRTLVIGEIVSLWNQKNPTQRG